MIADGLFERVLPLQGYDLCVEPSSEPPDQYETRFVDGDGDGRTDVLVRVMSKKCPLGYTQLVSAPQTITDTGVSYDDHRAFLAFRAKTLDDVVR